MQPSWAHLRLGEERPPGPVVAARVDRPSVLLAEHKVVVPPLRTRSHPLSELRRPVSPQRVAERAGEFDGPSACPRLRLHEDEPLTGLPLSAWRTVSVPASR